MLLNSLEELMNAVRNDRFAVYGCGRVGRSLADYLSENEIDFVIIDDFVQKEGVLRPSDIKGRINKVILATGDNSNKIKMKAVLDGWAYIYNIGRDLLEILDMTAFKKAFDDRFRPEHFQKNGFLDALTAGYLNGNIEYSCKVPILESYYYGGIRVEGTDNVVDAGASCSKYKDNTTLKFARDTKGTVFAFEPAPTIYKELLADVQGIENVQVFNIALSDDEGEGHFVESAGSSRIVETGGETTSKVRLARMDDVIKERVDFIKMDIEGAELAALKGAERLIREFKPKLAICVYHLPDDMIKIPEYIHSLNLGYKIWIENNEGNFWMGTKIFASVC